MLPLMDAHCHLQAEIFSGQIEKILARAEAAGIGKFLCCSTSPKDWNAVAALSLAHPEIIPAYGLHPWYLDRADADWQEAMARKLAADPEALIGEAGLDFERAAASFEDQESAFTAQLEIAREMHRSMSIHCRKAWHRLIPLLGRYSGCSNYALHSFSGAQGTVNQLAEIPGVFFSFSCSITNPANKRIADVIRSVPMNSILIETDSPDIPPFIGTGRASGPNEPAGAILVAERIAVIRNIPLPELLEIIAGNSAIYLRK